MKETLVLLYITFALPFSPFFVHQPAIERARFQFLAPEVLHAQNRVLFINKIIYLRANAYASLVNWLAVWQASLLVTLKSKKMGKAVNIIPQSYYKHSLHRTTIFKYKPHPFS